EAVVISNLNNGERFTTYAIAGPRDSGTVSLNGPTARKGAIGDQIIVFCYEYYNEDEIKRHEPRIIRVDDQNRMIT
ncbi:MAG TPA: aspartate 1-decarboxylase, partial [Nitrospirales bacterium]